MKRRHVMLGLALLVSAALAWFGQGAPGPELAEAVQRAPALRSAPERQSAPGSDAQVRRLRPRPALIGASFEAQGAGEQVFASQDWTPPPAPALAPPSAPAPAPSAPPVPYTYLGKALGEGNWEVYLARASQTYIVRKQSVIDGMYRVDAIAPPSMTLTYLPLNQVQQMNIGVLE